jgi:ribonuclease HII
VLYFEKKLKEKGYKLIIGVDEAGRGPLAGPVVAAAVILKTHRFKNRIDDSKKLTPCAREKAYEELVGKSVFGIGVVSEKEIDRVNILVATRIAMQEAIKSLLSKLKSKKESLHIIIDGQLKLDIEYPHTSIIKGDSRSKTIAAASILAKVTRDRIMDSYDYVYPGYGFAKHKGYPTKEHRRVIKDLGISLIHRRSFVYD